jgi:exopolysaccharide biosynthesis polyprenyl glycosylphosphotransferase
MYRQQVKIINTFHMFFDALSVVAAGYSSYATCAAYFPGQGSIPWLHFTLSIIFMILANNYFLGRRALYSDRKLSFLKMFRGICDIIISDFIIIAIGMIFMKSLYPYRLFYLLLLAYLLLYLLCERMLIRLYYNRPYNKNGNSRKVLLVGDRERGQIIVDHMHEQLSWGHEIVGYIPIKRNDYNGFDKPDTILKLLQTETIDEIIFALDADPCFDLRGILQRCKVLGVTARVVPALWTPGEKFMGIERLQGIPFLTFQGNNFNASGLLYKRVLDILGGFVGTLIFLMIYPFVALAIKADSPGPVLFKQLRVGQNGRKFYVYKFRSMYTDAEARKRELMQNNEMNGAIFKIKDDPRITKVGKWLRKTSVDEVPQFLNVILGQMSLVGTRPPTTDEVEMYQDWQYKRISVKPGITGLWQISGRSTIINFDEIVALDNSYIENWRFLDDIKILAKTVWVVLIGKGAE